MKFCTMCTGLFSLEIHAKIIKNEKVIKKIQEVREAVKKRYFFAFPASGKVFSGLNTNPISVGTVCTRSLDPFYIAVSEAIERLSTKSFKSFGNRLLFEFGQSVLDTVCQQQ